MASTSEERPIAEKTSVLKRLLQVVPIISALVAVLAFVTNLELRKKELTCIYLGNDNLISVESGTLTSVIKVDFQGKPMTSLAKMHFVVKNTGAAAIKGEDVKEAVGLRFPAGVQVLGAALDGTNPPGFSFDVHNEYGGSFVHCDFPLLNPGDEAYVSVYIYNSPARRPEMVGRIVDIKQILNVDNSQPHSPSPLPLIKNTGLRKMVYFCLVGLNGLIAAAVTVSFGALIFGFVRFKGWESHWGGKFREVADEYYKGRGYKPPPSMSVYEYPIPDERLKAAGVPEAPGTIANKWTELLGIGFVLVLITLFFILSAGYIATSPRGY